MKALSIRQPYAWLIVSGLKDIENRSWRTLHRGPLLIHAAARYSRSDHAYFDNVISRDFGIRLPDFGEMQLGGIVGQVDVTDCVAEHMSRWKNPESFGFVLANARPLPFLQIRGRLGLFDVSFSPEAPLTVKPSVEVQ